MKRRVLVIEERSSGHLLVFVRLIAGRALARGDEVVLATGASVPGTAEFTQNLAGLRLRTLTFQGPLTPRVIADLIGSVEPDLVIVPHGDEVACRLATTARSLHCRTVLLVMRDPRWEYPAPPARKVKNALKLALLAAARRHRSVDLVWLRGYGYNGGDRHAIDPFIADGGLEEVMAAGRSLRKELFPEPDVFWFVVTGAITDRKNVNLIIQALAQAQRSDPRSRFGLAIIGPHRTSYPIDRDAIRQMSGGVYSVVSQDRLLTNFEMNAVVASADAVVMAYDTHSPNSTMLKARALGTRLVVAGPPSVRSFALDMGFTSVVRLDCDELAGALRRASCSPAPKPCPSVPDGNDFADALLSGR